MFLSASAISLAGSVKIDPKPTEVFFVKDVEIPHESKKMLFSSAWTMEEIGPFRIIDCPVKVLDSDHQTAAHVHIWLADEGRIPVEFNCYFLNYCWCAAKTPQFNPETHRFWA
jgi:hypothetical protein